MKNSKKTGKQEEEVADMAISGEKDAMNEIKQFVRKKKLQNQVLKRLSEELEGNLIHELNKPKSA
jgi:hypothetical protein